MKSRLAAVIVIGLVALQLVTIGIVVTMMAQTANDSLADHAADVAEAAARTTAELADDYLSDVEETLTATAGLARRGVIDLADPVVAGAYLLEQVAADDRIDGMYWADPAGGFVYVARSDEKAPGGFRTKTISVAGDERTTTLTWRSAGLEFIETVTDATDTYDPVERPWFSRATAASGIVWTDPYVYYTSRTTGVTAALALDAGDASGVVGIDVRLARLTDFLSTAPAGSDATAIIVTPDGALIAHPDPEALIAIDPTNGAPTVARVDTLEDPAAAVPNDRTGTFEHEGHRHVSARASLGTGWDVVVAAPEGAFLDDVQSAQRTGLYLVIAAALLALVVTVPLVVWLTRSEETPADTPGVDRLTALPDRHAFHEQAAPAFHEARQSRKPVSVVMVDLDHFQQINETYGHITADEIVGAVGGRMRGALSERDLIARFGGDEFAVLLPRVDVVTARTIASRLRRAVTQAPIKTSHGPVYTTVSVGVATADDPSSTLEGLIHDADGALFRAKRGGRDRIEVADTTIVPVRRTTNN